MLHPDPLSPRLTTSSIHSSLLKIIHFHPRSGLLCLSEVNLKIQVPLLLLLKLGILAPAWIKPWVLWSEQTADPALSRSLDLMTWCSLHAELSCRLCVGGTESCFLHLWRGWWNGYKLCERFWTLKTWWEGRSAENIVGPVKFFKTRNENEKWIREMR